MIRRELQLIDSNSLFIFGPRGVGKTTYLKNSIFFPQAIYINLLKASEENKFSRNPDELATIVQGLDLAAGNIRYVIIDEVQKLPKLLDVVHDLIETTSIKFILTGSSARKLKQDGANLLAGRAFVYSLFPFCITEIENQVESEFSLNNALRWGMLPKIFECETDLSKLKFLEAYTNTYLKEEIWLEQVVRDLAPFQYFLQVAAQSNGKLVNFSKMAQDVGTSDMSVKKYYGILEDTLLGFFLQPFQHSFRKRLGKIPKFYFFDPGVVRSLAGRVSVPLEPSTMAYGDAFEHFIILQCKQLATYHRHEYRFSFIKTKEDAEIDLVVERPGQKLLLIEIKSTDQIKDEHLKTLNQIHSELENSEAVCFSQDPYPKKIGEVLVLPWLEGVKKYFGAL